MDQTIKINGQEKSFAPGQWPKTLTDLLNQMQCCQAAVVAEIDGNIVRREDFDKTTVLPGQSIEVVRFVGGG